MEEEIPKIEKKPTEWMEPYDARALTFIKDWGKEKEEMFPMPSMSDMLNIALQTPAGPVPEAPSTSNTPLLIPTALTTNDAPSDYENEVLTVMDLKEELYESQLRLSEADGSIKSLHYEISDLEDQWMSRSEVLERELKKIRTTMISYYIIEDTSTSSSEKQIEDPFPIVVEDPLTTIIVYEPPPTFEEEDKESIGEFE
ncbi:hypothetical protein Dimus_017783, partial [Dionaea muscipula]